MRRNIEFMAKRIDNKEWIRGGYFHHQNRTPCPIGDSIKESDYTDYILQSGFSDWNMMKPIEAVEVDGDTLCEKSEYKAENGDIFERHILGFLNYSLSEEYEYVEGVVEIRNGAWKVRLIQDTHGEPIEEIDWKSLSYVCRDGQVKIVGNEIDNPERLEIKFWDPNASELVKRWEKESYDKWKANENVK